MIFPEEAAVQEEDDFFRSLVTGAGQAFGQYTEAEIAEEERKRREAEADVKRAEAERIRAEAEAAERRARALAEPTILGIPRTFAVIGGLGLAAVAVALALR